MKIFHTMMKALWEYNWGYSRGLMGIKG
jgi:hypothetical protein